MSGGSSSQANKNLQQYITKTLQSQGKININNFIKTIPQKYYSLSPHRIGKLLSQRDDVIKININEWEKR